MRNLKNLEKRQINCLTQHTILTKLNDITSGINENELVILAALPGMGKTTLALDLLYDYNMQKKKSLFISCEMDAYELERRLEIINSSTKHPEMLDSSLIYIEDDNNIDIITIENDIKECHPDVLFIDYIQLLNGKVKQLSRQLKLLARKYKLPIICLAQRNRTTAQVEKWIEQDADQVWLITLDHVIKDKVWFDSNEKVIVYNLTVVKNRKAKTGVLQVIWNKVRFVFMEYRMEKDEPNRKRELDEIKELETFESEKELYERWKKYYEFKYSLNDNEFDKDDIDAIKVIFGGRYIV